MIQANWGTRSTLSVLPRRSTWLVGWCVFVCVCWGKLFFFLETSPSALPFNSRATEGLNIPARTTRLCVWMCACVCACFHAHWGYIIVRGTVVTRKTAINSTRDSRKLSQVVHQLVETESDILRAPQLDCFAVQRLYFKKFWLFNFFLFVLGGGEEVGCSQSEEEKGVVVPPYKWITVI